LFAAISPGIIAFTLYTKVQKYLGASLTGFTLYIFSIYSAIYGIILFDEALLNFHYFRSSICLCWCIFSKED
jgi:drug/metabolite transporter (DMT)-like permease